MRKIVIICQAPADVQYLIDLYRRKQLRCDSIFVINVYNVFLFLQSLKLDDVRLYFIPYKLFSCKNVVNVIKEKKRLSKIWEQYKDIFYDSDIYFFSIYEDWVTGYLLNKIEHQPHGDIYYYNHYDNSNLYVRRKVLWGNRIRLLILKYITGVSFKGEIVEKFPEYQLSDKITTIVPVCEYHKEFFYKVPKGKNCMLFLSAADDMTLFTYKSYILTVKKIVRELQTKSYNVFIKAHPRVGIQKELVDIVGVNIIPEYIPSEFIDTQEYELCLGFESTSLVGFSNNEIKTYSLLLLLDIISEKRCRFMMQYLTTMSGGKIRFISSTDF